MVLIAVDALIYVSKVLWSVQFQNLCVPKVSVLLGSDGEVEIIKAESQENYCSFIEVLLKMTL